MPSVEMRRTTRVFGARVLRSGRRLFTSEDELKRVRRGHLPAEDAEEDWIELIDRGGGAADVEFKDWHNPNEGNNEIMDIDDGEPQSEIQLGESMEDGSADHVYDNTGCRRWGLVYSRKRKRSGSVSTDHGSSICSDKKFGKKFVRKQAKKTIITQDSSTNFQKFPPNLTTKQPDKPSRSKSRRKKPTRVPISTPTAMNLRNLPARNGSTIHRAIRRRRSSFRLRKQRKYTGPVEDGVPFFPIKSNPELSRSIRRPSFKELKSTLVELTQDIDSASCNANILLIESDRCYREANAVITMEMSSPKQWFLVVKRNGIERFKLEARTIMRPCFCNRVTHAIIWAGCDESWKLEFPNRQDWFVFKELYRKCSERSIKLQASITSIIPVPRVNEVSGYADMAYVPFKMPDSYISFYGDEVSRVLERSDPVYDMDSDDEEWLNEFNVDRESRVDEDLFEKIIDAFEKGIYGNPEEYSNVTSAVDRCLFLASKDVLEAVFDYWMAKRKKKHSALVRLFQFYKPKRTEQLNIKAVLRKKRSFRHRGNQSGRGKQLTFLKAALYERNVAEEADNAASKVEETEAASKRAGEVAKGKREKAQMLMEIADLLTYKATMALKIAEAAGVACGPVNDDDNDKLLSGEWLLGF